MVNILFPLIIALSLWEGLSKLSFVNQNILPAPSIVFVTFIKLAGSGILFTNALSSLSRVLVGFIIATITGVSSGVFLGTFPKFGKYFIPLLDLLRPIPPIAWIPIAILWFGLGDRSAVFIVSIGAFFPIFLNTFSGIQAVSTQYINAARCLGASSRLIMLDILFPAAMPQIFTGIRVGIGIAWTSVIASEMVGAREGLGYAIQLNRTLLETEAVITNMILIGFIGWTMNSLLIFIEQITIPWSLLEANDTRN